MATRSGFDLVKLRADVLKTRLKLQKLKIELNEKQSRIIHPHEARILLVAEEKEAYAKTPAARDALHRKLEISTAAVRRRTGIFISTVAIRVLPSVVVYRSLQWPELSEFSPNERVHERPAGAEPRSADRGATQADRAAIQSNFSVEALSGVWQLTGAMQNGTPLSGQAYLNENLTFQTGAQGVVTAAGAWNIDAAQRTVHLQGRHVLYGIPANFTCTLAAEDTSGRSLQGTCTDFAGTGSLRLAH